MISFKEDILITLFGGRVCDYDMLDKCKYSFEDILECIKSFTTIEDMTFDDILVGAINLYQNNIQNIIENKIKEKKKEIKCLKNELGVCGYGKRELYELEIAKDDLEKLEQLDITDDMDYDVDYSCNSMWFVDDDIKEIYEELLSKEIEEENKKIGFCSLDLDVED